MIKNIKNIFILLLFICILLPTNTFIYEISALDTKSISNQGDRMYFTSSSFGELSYEPTFYDFNDTYPGEEKNTTFEIWNSGCCSLVYNLIEESSWVSVNPTKGVSSGKWDHHIINVTINTTNLSVGTHSYDIIIDTNDNTGIFRVDVTIIELPNTPPNRPILNGPEKGKHGETYIFTATTTDLDDDQLFYKWKFTEYNITDWIGPYESNEPCLINHTWNEKGDYDIKVKAKDTRNEESNWSESHVIQIPKKNFNFPKLNNFFQMFSKFRFIFDLKNIIKFSNTIKN